MKTITSIYSSSGGAMLKRTYLPAVLVALSLNTAAAQDRPSTLEPGARVRITVPDLGIEKQQATFQALHGDTLVVVADSNLYFPVGSITRFDVYRGRHRSATRAVGFGAIGFAGGAAVGCVGLYNISSYQGDDKALECVLGGMIGGLVGGVVGAVIGVSSRDRWEEVPLDQLRVSYQFPSESRETLWLSLGYGTDRESDASGGLFGGRMNLFTALHPIIAIGPEVGYYLGGERNLWNIGGTIRLATTSEKIRLFGVGGLGYYSWGLTNFLGATFGGGVQGKVGSTAPMLSIEARWHENIQDVGGPDPKFFTAMAGMIITW